MVLTILLYAIYAVAILFGCALLFILGFFVRYFTE